MDYILSKLLSVNKKIYPEIENQFYIQLMRNGKLRFFSVDGRFCGHTSTS